MPVLNEANSIRSSNCKLDTKAVALRAGISLHLRQQVVGSRPIFEFVVIAEIDFVEAGRLWPATMKIAPPIKRPRWRTCCCAARVIDEFVGQLVDRCSQLEVPNFETTVTLFGTGRNVRPMDETH